MKMFLSLLLAMLVLFSCTVVFADSEQTSDIPVPTPNEPLENQAPVKITIAAIAAVVIGSVISGSVIISKRKRGN
ncbi:MAG: hypothetical protein E7491_01390 [Ruminococcaceae bacterium]|nr:hypothetical protein [Oscillospiraceae bacterium]